MLPTIILATALNINLANYGTNGLVTFTTTDELHLDIRFAASWKETRFTRDRTSLQIIITNGAKLKLYLVATVFNNQEYNFATQIHHVEVGDEYRLTWYLQTLGVGNVELDGWIMDKRTWKTTKEKH